MNATLVINVLIIIATILIIFLINSLMNFALTYYNVNILLVYSSCSTSYNQEDLRIIIYSPNFEIIKILKINQEKPEKIHLSMNDYHYILFDIYGNTLYKGKTILINIILFVFI